MTVTRRAFTMIEAVMVAVILAILALLMLPAMKQKWNADGQSISINNVRRLLVACGEYRLDHDERVPMRGTGYSNGIISGGWTTWNFAGKHCDTWWTFNTPFADEKAFCRFLNPYIQPLLAPTPTGHINTGANATWTFVQGTVTPQQRAAFTVKVCKSPGDIATRQRNEYPLPTPGISGFDDIGTSYVLNMKWWSQAGLPGNFTTRYNAGTDAMRNIRGPKWYRAPSNFVWIHDQTPNAVSSGFNAIGEFGGQNMSVVGYLDGRAAYIPITLNAMSGPGYTFGLP